MPPGPEFGACPSFRSYPDGVPTIGVTEKGGLVLEKASCLRSRTRPDAYKVVLFRTTPIFVLNAVYEIKLWPLPLYYARCSD